MPTATLTREPRRLSAVWLAIPVLLFAAAPAEAAWSTLAPGLDLGRFSVTRPASADSAEITVLRIDPDLWTLEVAGQGGAGTPTGLTARQWCDKYGLAAAINAGMYATDRRTHVGYLESRGQVISSRVNGYQSVAAFDPAPGRDLPRFRIFDLDEPGVTMAGILEDYGSAVQNLRLIKRPGVNRWKQQDKRWSEAALGEDGAGNILFIFTRAPWTMHDFNEALLRLDIGVVAAQHLEGDSPAQLYLQVGERELELVGRPELAPLPIPNVLGIRRR